MGTGWTLKDAINSKTKLETTFLACLSLGNNVPALPAKLGGPLFCNNPNMLFVKGSQLLFVGITRNAKLLSPCLMQNFRQIRQLCCQLVTDEGQLLYL